MKKFLSLLSVMTLLIMGTGCSSTNTEEFVVPDNEYENLVISDLKYDESSSLLSFKSENTGDTTLSTGLFYTVEKYVDGEWIDTKLTDDLVVAEIAILIEPGKTIDDGVDLSHVMPLDDDCYRVVKSYGDGSDNINLYLQFEVIDGEILDLVSYNEVV